MIFIDSNIPMYVAGRDHPVRSPADSDGRRNLPASPAQHGSEPRDTMGQ